jgi:hypothetical protein
MSVMATPRHLTCGRADLSPAGQGIHHPAVFCVRPQGCVFAWRVSQEVSPLYKDNESLLLTLIGLLVAVCSQATAPSRLRMDKQRSANAEVRTLGRVVYDHQLSTNRV